MTQTNLGSTRWYTVVFCVLLVGGIWTALYLAAGQYRVIACLAPAPDGATLTFRNRLGHIRDYTFVEHDGASGLGGLLKHPIAWSEIDAFHAMPTNDPDSVDLWVTLTDSLTYELGLIDRACYARLRGRYNSLRFVDD